MASPGGRSLGLLLWLLLLPPPLGASSPSSSPSSAASSAPSSAPSSPGGGPEGPGASVWRAAGPPATSRPHEAATPPQVVPVTPRASGSYGAVTEAQPTRTKPLLTTGCGHRSMRIIGGLPAPERKWPWQVSLQINEKHMCGASLIASRWVLTAAHCIFGYVEYTVKMGDIYMRHTSDMAVKIPVQDIVIHKDYNPLGLIENDIALVLLEFPVNFSTHIHPVCLPEKAFLVQAGTECWVTGWGKLSEKDSSQETTEELQEAELNIIRYERCNEILQTQLETSSDVVKKGMLCGYNVQGKDACQGDSGGPLACEFNETWVQVGIVSWGIGCGRKNYPGIYTEVSLYRDWVIDHLSQACSWDSAGFFPLLCLLLPLGILVAP